MVDFLQGKKSIIAPREWGISHTFILIILTSEFEIEITDIFIDCSIKFAKIWLDLSGINKWYHGSCTFYNHNVWRLVTKTTWQVWELSWCINMYLSISTGLLYMLVYFWKKNRSHLTWTNNHAQSHCNTRNDQSYFFSNRK